MYYNHKTFIQTLHILHLTLSHMSSAEVSPESYQ